MSLPRLKIKNKQLLGTGTIRTKRLSSKPNWEITKTSTRHETKGTYGYPREQRFPNRWPLSYHNRTQQLSLVIRKSGFCICENKDADQLRGNREADQRLCFRYIDSTIPLLAKSKISSL